MPYIINKVLFKNIQSVISRISFHHSLLILLEQKFDTIKVNMSEHKWIFQNMHVYFIMIIIWKQKTFYAWIKLNKQEKITNENDWTI